MTWWRDAVIYQIYPRSFADASGDGVGDLPGILAHLDHLVSLGIDAIWLSPFYPSPQLDGGYDISDYCDVDPLFGTLDDFDTLLDAAHQVEIKVIVDLVPNHCSWDHPAFRAALAAGPGAPERDMFMFRPGRGEGGEEPPTDWISGASPAWTRITEEDGTPGPWYLHLFDTSQPDWNWRNPAVVEMFDDVLRFWLDRGVDGFRVDVSHGLMKDESWPDWSGSSFGLIPTSDPATRPPFWDHDDVHEVYRRWRRILDEYDGDRIMVAEAWLSPDRLSRYVRPDEMHQAFNFAYLETGWQAEALREVITSTTAADAAVGAPTTWVLSNHDVIRHATRMGYPAGTVLPFGLGPLDPAPDAALGLRRARAATLLMLALPGAAYLFQGEELGLPEAIDLPDDERRDPHWIRSKGALRGRDGCRAPFPWRGGVFSSGFSGAWPWLTAPAIYRELAVDRQGPGSTLWIYRCAIALRRRLGLGAGQISWVDGLPAGVLAFVNGETLVIANTSDVDIDLAGSAVLAGFPRLVLESSAGEVSGTDGEQDLALSSIARANSTVWAVRAGTVVPTSRRGAGPAPA